MVEVKLINRSISAIMDIVYELRHQGSIQGVDFDFAYYPEKYDNFTGHTIQKHTIFRFYNHEHATWFTLKWADNE